MGGLEETNKGWLFLAVPKIKCQWVGLIQILVAKSFLPTVVNK